jgi:hypothetical protein
VLILAYINAIVGCKLECLNMCVSKP